MDAQEATQEAAAARKETESVSRSRDQLILAAQARDKTISRLRDERDKLRAQVHASEAAQGDSMQERPAKRKRERETQGWVLEVEEPESKEQAIEDDFDFEVLSKPSRPQASAPRQTKHPVIRTLSNSSNLATGPKHRKRI